MSQDGSTPWPQHDLELASKMAAATDAQLHHWMCDCAEHALAVCEPLCADTGYLCPPDPTPIEVKRRWLAGTATEDALADAQREAVCECYYGKSIELGAAVLGTAWYPGSGLTLPEDEAYAESMTHYPGALAAARDVMRQCVQAVRTFTYNARWKSEGSNLAAAAAQRAGDAERAWQRDHILSKGSQEHQLT
jgi:hypothetical protein